MKKTVFGHLLSVALVGSLLLSGCQKEKTGFLRLNAERLTSNEKTYVDGTTVQWKVGDQVWVNGTVYELVNDNTVSGNPIGDDLLAIYPSSIIGNPAPSSNQVAVTIPSVYTYETDVIGGYTKQILAMPMVGVAEGSATSMTMKHLCSAMEVSVTNSFSEGLVLDSIILRGSGLSGNSTVTFSDNVPAPGAGNVDSVRISFSNCTIAVNGNLTVQIPVLPVAEGIRVSVRGHLATSGTFYRYSRSTTNALVRAMVHAAPVTMSTTNNNTRPIIVENGHLNGIFTVNSNPLTRIRFSSGNLRATTEDRGQTWTWCFAEHQYEYIGNASGNTTVHQNRVDGGYVDLFGWSTDSRTTHFGINNSTNQRDYSGAFVDWGTTMGEGWRTLTKDEWNYLLNTRSTSSGVRYVKATVNGVRGLIILPDNWSTSYYSLNTAANHGYTDNTIDSDVWTNSLEVHGAVFLPAAGRRIGQNVTNEGTIGYYWSSTSHERQNYRAYYVYIVNNSLNAGDNDDLSIGKSVRLVQDI